MGRLADINAARNQAAGVQDRLGRTLEAGDFIVANPQVHTLIQVTDVRPQMDPAGPKGHVISGVAQFQFFAPSGKRLPDLLFVMRPERKAKEEQDDDKGPGLYFGCGKHKAGDSKETLCPICSRQPTPSNGTGMLAGYVRRWFGK